jgi:hypothetical protein
MRSKAASRLPLIALLLILTASQAPLPEALGGEEKTTPFDREAVFCIYHRLAKDAMGDQDIEDFLSFSGTPAFSRFKPGEMFTRATLTRTRRRLEQRSRSWDRQVFFRWVLPFSLRECRDIINAEGRRSLENRMPHPTACIRARLEAEGFGRLRKAFPRVEARIAGNVQNRGALRVAVYLRALEAQYAPETRNIALEDVVIPIGYVLFCPVKIEVFAASRPRRILSGDLLVERQVTAPADGCSRRGTPSCQGMCIDPFRLCQNNDESRGDSPFMARPVVSGAKENL